MTDRAILALRVIAILMGGVAVYCELRGVYEFMSHLGYSPLHYLMVGSLLAACTAGIAPSYFAALFGGKSYGWGMLAFGLWVGSLSFVIMTAYERTAGAAETIQHKRDRDALHKELAEKAVREGEAALSEDRQKAARECASGFGEKCKAATAAAERIQARLDAAREMLRSAPMAGTDPIAQLAHDWFGMSEATAVRLKSLLVPIIVSLVAVMCISFGVHPPKAVSRPQEAAPRREVAASDEPAPSRAVAVARQRKPATAKPGEPTLNADPVVSFMKLRMTQDDAAITDWADIYRSYTEWGEGEPLTPAQFGAVLAHICDKAGIPVKSRNNKAYCVGMRIAA